MPKVVSTFREKQLCCASLIVTQESNETLKKTSSLLILVNQVHFGVEIDGVYSIAMCQLRKDQIAKSKRM